MHIRIGHFSISQIYQKQNIFLDFSWQRCHPLLDECFWPQLSDTKILLPGNETILNAHQSRLIGYKCDHKVDYRLNKNQTRIN